MPLFTNMTELLKKWPLHILLLPCFFILNISQQFTGLLETKELIRAFVEILSGIVVLFLLLNRRVNDKAKAGLISFLFGIYFLFFYTFKEKLAGIPVLDFFSHYRIYIPASLLLLAIIFYKIAKLKKTSTLTLFFNLLLLIYTGMELWKYAVPAIAGENLEKGSLQVTDIKVKNTGTVSYPDIYYIIFDSYPSPAYQEEVLGLKNQRLDSFLTAKGFFVIKNSISNYNRTAFSIASSLRMQYLDWIRDKTIAVPYHYNKAMQQIEDAVVLKWLAANNYELINLSVFDWQGQAPLVKERFITASSRQIIYFNTLWYRIKWDAGLYLLPSFHKKSAAINDAQNKSILSAFKSFNSRVADSLIRLSAGPVQQQPKFVYCHLELPHFPFFYDSSGFAYPENDIYSNAMLKDKNRFRNYLIYTDKQVIKLANSLLRMKNAVIILQSDHGVNEFEGSEKKDVFRNYSSFYFPDRDYRQLYPGMSNVNTFRVLFNKYFGQQLPLLSDSSIYIK